MFRMPVTVRKMGKSGAGGKVVAPQPGELEAPSPEVEPGKPRPSKEPSLPDASAGYEVVPSSGLQKVRGYQVTSQKPAVGHQVKPAGSGAPLGEVTSPKPTGRYHGKPGGTTLDLEKQGVTGTTSEVQKPGRYHGTSQKGGGTFLETGSNHGTSQKGGGISLETGGNHGSSQKGGGTSLETSGVTMVREALPRTRKAAGGADTKSPQETSYGSSNLAAAVLKSLQRDKHERRYSESGGGGENTPRPLEVSETALPEVPLKKVPTSRSVPQKEPKSTARSTSDANPRRSVSAQPVRECRHRQPFDCSSKIGPSLATSRGVAKAFLKSSKSSESEKSPSSLLPDRVSALEEKIAQLSLELKDTKVKLRDTEVELRDAKSEIKELLRAGIPANNKAVQEIQVRVGAIEKTITGTTSSDLGRRASLSSLENADLESRRSCGHRGIEERMLPHLMLLKNRPSLQQKLIESRAALQRKLSEERLLLSSKIAALEGSEVRTAVEGEVITAEFLASLNHGNHAEFTMVTDDVENVVPMRSSPRTVEKPPSDGSTRKNNSERKRKSMEEHEAAPPIAAAASLSLECEETMFDTEDREDDQENAQPPPATEFQTSEVFVESEETVRQIGTKVATAGWYVYDGEGILLAYEDGTCAFYDAPNMDEKSVYKSPEGIAPAAWRDCWLVRAADSDGRANKYILAVSAGTATNPGFCSWKFYDKTIAAYHSDVSSWPGTPNKSSEDTSPRYKSSSSCGSAASGGGGFELPLWWYRPCGSLVASCGTGTQSLSLYDVRDGEMVMKWGSNRMISGMDFCSPMQWRSKNTMLVAEDGELSVWEIGNQSSQQIHSVQLGEKDIQAMYIYNSDGECNGGVRQRISSKDCGNIDGVFATQDAVHSLDTRTPSGIALKIPTFGQRVHSIYAHGDAVYAGVTCLGKPMIQQWSIKMANPMLLYTLPGSTTSCHESHFQISQVWGSADVVMAINGNGLFVFEPSSSEARAVIGSDDLYSPSFDYCNSKVLLVSRDRPAMWQYWP